MPSALLSCIDIRFACLSISFHHFFTSFLPRFRWSFCFGMDLWQAVHIGLAHSLLLHLHMHTAHSLNAHANLQKWHNTLARWPRRIFIPGRSVFHTHSTLLHIDVTTNNNHDVQLYETPVLLFMLDTHCCIYSNFVFTMDLFLSWCE